MIINKIIGGGGSGLSPTIVVTAPTGSTVQLDGIAGTEVSGTWTFATTIGSHTVSATYNGTTKTQAVTVDAVAVYPVTISFTVTLTTSNFSTYFTASNSTYYFSGSGSTWTSTNYNVNSSTATSTWTAKSAMNISIDWSVSSEANYDKFTMTVAGTTKVNAVSGTQSGTVTASISAGQTIVLTYSKDGSAKSGSDTAYVTNIVISEAQPTSKLFLYNEGDECTSVTGGWVGKVYYPENGYYSNGTETKESSQLSMVAGYQQSAGFFTNNQIDLSNYSTIYINCTVYPSSTNYSSVVFNTAQVRIDSSSSETQITSTGEFTIDISSVSGSRYIGFGNQNWTSGTTITLKINKVWLE